MPHPLIHDLHHELRLHHFADNINNNQYWGDDDGLFIVFKKGIIVFHLVDR